MRIVVRISDTLNSSSNCLRTDSWTPIANPSEASYKDEEPTSQFGLTDLHRSLYLFIFTSVRICGTKQLFVQDCSVAQTAVNKLQDFSLMKLKKRTQRNRLTDENLNFSPSTDHNKRHI
jgi:hypothetical protein